MKILSLPVFDGGSWNTKMLNPKTGKFEIHGLGSSVLIGGEYCEKVTPSDRQLKKIRNDIDRYLKYRESLNVISND